MTRPTPRANLRPPATTVPSFRRRRAGGRSTGWRAQAYSLLELTFAMVILGIFLASVVGHLRLQSQVDRQQRQLAAAISVLDNTLERLAALPGPVAEAQARAVLDAEFAAARSMPAREDFRVHLAPLPAAGDAADAAAGNGYELAILRPDGRPLARVEVRP